MKTKFAGVKEYIVSVIDTEGTEVEKIKFFFETFYSEYGYNVQRLGLCKAVQDYLQGLPTTVNHAFANHEIIGLLIEWKFLTPKSREATMGRELDSYWNYLAVALVNLGQKYKAIK